MFLYNIYVIVFVLGVGSAYDSWDNQVFMGRQWNDYLTPTSYPSPEVHTDSILLLYTPACVDEYDSLGLHEGLRPPGAFLIFGKHDCVTSPKLIWYYLDEKDRLCDRYNFADLQCGSYLYFAKGSDINTPTEIYHPQHSSLSVLEWMWSKLEVEVSVQNSKTVPVTISFHGRGPKVASMTLQPGEKVNLEIYQSYVLLISDGERFLHGQVVNKDAKSTTITITDESTMGKAKARKWFKTQDNELMQKSKDKHAWRWGIAGTYLMNFKQPTLLPKWTEQGYKKGKMPQHLYEDIIRFYREHECNRKDEEHDVEPAINDSEVKCSMVFFDEEMIKHIGTVMKPYLEEWINFTLVQTRLYGIREYHRGNILRDHVDRITTHVVSVILQIDQELDGGNEWELEVITFDGMRHNLTLAPGDMVFYESATLIHGRPFPFQGKNFANAFLHYKPKENWQWGVSEDNRYITKNGIAVEPLHIFDSRNFRARVIKDEL